MKRKRVEGWVIVGTNGEFAPHMRNTRRELLNILSMLPGDRTVRMREVLPAEDAALKALLEWSDDAIQRDGLRDKDISMYRAAERYRKAVK